MAKRNNEDSLPPVSPRNLLSISVLMMMTILLVGYQSVHKISAVSILCLSPVRSNLFVSIGSPPPVGVTFVFLSLSSMGLKLIYFDVRGFGEYIRTLLVDQKIDFEDQRLTFDEWPQYKEKMPMGQLPILEEGGKKIPQTHAILRHLARTHGLYGANEEEQTFLDVFQEALKDVRMKYIWMIMHNFENGKKEFDEVTYPTLLEGIEKLFKAHGNGDKFILGEKVSYVDYILFEELELALANPFLLKCYGVCESVCVSTGREIMAEWLRGRSLIREVEGSDPAGAKTFLLFC